MNFFARQEAARRKTRVLLLNYVAAVFLIVWAFYFASRFLFLCLDQASDGDRQTISLIDTGKPAFRIFAWNRIWFTATAAVTLLVIAGGTLWRRATLAEGGAAVARSAGGREIGAAAEAFHERRLLNIVEEVALASGIPVPRVFVLDDERGINAFAAGFTVHDAAVAVTRAAMEQLTREELQGVVAHEFSHILNGDMRLNSWLLGVLFGILCLSVSGRGLMRLLSETRPSSKGGGGIVFFLFMCGLVLWSIGSVGVFFARLIQCSVTRQRECLADASAVQFTRNPIGLANALKRIGATPLRHALRCANRSELTHFLIASGRGAALDALLASHPPIIDRIRALDPSFNGDFAPWRIQTLTFDDLQNTPAGIAARETNVLMGFAGGEVVQVTRFLDALDPELRSAVSHPFVAAGVLYGLLLSEDRAPFERQAGRIVALEGQPLLSDAQKWRARFRPLGQAERRMVAELAVEGVRQRDPASRAACVRVVREMIAADGETSLFEQLLEKRIEARLIPGGSRNSLPRAVVPAPRMQMEASLVLGALAYAGQPKDDFLARGAWWLGSGNMPSFNLGELLPVRSSCTPQALMDALARLADLSPQAKGELVAGCAAVVAEDGQWTPDEVELLRAICDLLEMPLPNLPSMKAG